MMQRSIVSATRIEKSPWRYASLPGFEVLSRAPDRETNWELDALKRGQMFRDLVIPDDWYPRSPVPYTVIIDDADLGNVVTGQLHSHPIVFRAPVDALTWGELSDKANVSSDLAEAFDADTYAINANVYGVLTESPVCASSGTKRLLDCAPPLPGWLIAGLISTDSGILRGGFALVARKEEGLLSSERATVASPGALLGGQRSGGQDARGEDQLTLIQRPQRAAGPGTLWVSLEQTQQLLIQLRRDKKTKIVIPPLSELFSEAPPSDERRRLWESEAGLFVRWGLMGPGHDEPATSRAFLELAQRARREPVTEQMFSECFGFGYSTMERKLEKFLRAVLAKPTSLELVMPLGFPEREMKEATPDQVGRILGDWLRMQGNAHREDPGLRGEFLEAAGRMLERAYRDSDGPRPDPEPARGEQHAAPPQGAAFDSAAESVPFVVAADQIHDPRLLAVYGLYEHDIGNDSRARELLEAAAKAGVVRPKAYLVLAELLYSEAMARPSGTQGQLGAEQLASVLGPLRTALRYAPSSEIYSRIAEVRSHCEVKPSYRDIEEIADGVSMFPRDTDLSYSSALFCAKNGYGAKAEELISKGLVFAANESSREQFEQLRSTLAVPPLPGAK